MRMQSVAASTHTDRQGMRMTIEALESMLGTFESNRRPVYNVEHDISLPPLGQIIQGHIEPTDDGEYCAVVTSEVFESSEKLILPTGEEAIKTQSHDEKYPFINVVMDAPEICTLGYDWANFASQNERRLFLEEARIGSQLPFKEQVFGRKSLVPDPQLIITLSQTICSYLLTRKVGEKLIGQVGDDIAKVYAFIRSTLMTYVRYAQPRNRPHTYVFDIPGKPQIELVARTSDVDLLMSSLELDRLVELVERATEYRDTLGAEKVQFLFSTQGNWGFNYLLTDTGAVIGTPASFARRARVIQHVWLKPRMIETPD